MGLLDSLPLSGYKSYIVVGVAAILLGLAQLGYLDPTQVETVVTWLALAFGVTLRHAVSK